MKPQKPKPRNPVAKHMEKFNRPSTERDRTKYKRKDKRGRIDPFSLSEDSDQ